MSLLAATLILSNDRADALGDLLLEAGALAVNVADANEGTPAESPIFGEPGAESRYWFDCRMTVFFGPDADVGAALRTAAAELEVQLPEFSVAQVEDIDWVRENREQFQPIRISERLFIVPTWHAQAFTPPAAHAVSLILDPGAAFGTGSHPTTRLCLLWLERTMGENTGAGILDYGCGSGILAIAAMKLGAAHATGVDIDLQALETARQNAMQNQVAAEFISSETALAMQADVAVANILANPLIVLAPLIASHVRQGGQLALAGILAHQADDVLAVYRRWFDIGVDSRDEDWVCLAGTRKPGA